MNSTEQETVEQAIRKARERVRACVEAIRLEGAKRMTPGNLTELRRLGEFLNLAANEALARLDDRPRYDASSGTWIG